jgi:hypothetical protein
MIMAIIAVLIINKMFLLAAVAEALSSKEGINVPKTRPVVAAKLTSTTQTLSRVSYRTGL